MHLFFPMLVDFKGSTSIPAESWSSTTMIYWFPREETCENRPVISLYAFLVNGWIVAKHSFVRSLSKDGIVWCKMDVVSFGWASVDCKLLCYWSRWPLRVRDIRFLDDKRNLFFIALKKVDRDGLPHAAWRKIASSVLVCFFGIITFADWTFVESSSGILLVQFGWLCLEVGFLMGTSHKPSSTVRCP